MSSLAKAEPNRVKMRAIAKLTELRLQLDGTPASDESRELSERIQRVAQLRDLAAFAEHAGELFLTIQDIRLINS